jgi:hypothetical protein
MIDQLGAALKKLESSIPEDYRKQQASRERKHHELTESLRVNCYDALEDITAALRFPGICLHHLEDALAKLTVARDCAKVLEGE